MLSIVGTEEMDNSTVHENLPRLAWPGLSQRTREQAARVLDRTIFIGVLALIPLIAIPYGAVQPQWEATFECVVFALVALWIIEGYLGGAWQVRGLRLLAPLAALIALAFFQTLPLWGESITAGVEVQRAMSADPYQTRLVAFKLIALTLSLGLLMRYTAGERRLRALIYVVIGVGVASALFGFVRATSQRELPGFILPYLGPGEGYAQFINRNHFALLIEMSLGLVLGFVAGGGVPRNRLLLYFAATILLCTTIVASNSRGGILSMLGQMIFVAVLFATVRTLQHRPTPGSSAIGWLQRLRSSLVVRITLIACLVAVVVIGIVWVGGDPLANRLEAVPGEMRVENTDTRHGERRIEIWRATLQLIKAHPLTGVGFGGYWIAIPEHHNASGAITPQEAHNDYLELLASGGMIGVVLGAWFVIVLIKLALRQLRSRNSFRRAASFGALAGLFGVAVHSFVDFGLHVTVNALVFMALVVIATVNGQLKEKPALTSKHSSGSLQKN